MSDNPALGDVEEAQLCTFKCKECFVYMPLPPAPSYGHRAELWNPDKWQMVVRMRVVVVVDDMYVRLEDKDSGELFAECPLPSDGTPFTTAVEPVIDSSRYFVLKVVDRGDPKKHAFLGVGFRERSEASNFTAALDDHRQYLRRAREAEELRREFQERAALEQDGAGAEGGSGAPAVDMSLKPGEKIRLNIGNSSLSRRASAGSGAAAAAPGAASSSGEHAGGPGVIVAADGAGVLLKPPPPAGASKRGLDVSGGGAAPGGQAGPSGASGGKADDDWGDFVG